MIYHITGPKKSGKSHMGNALRNTHIGKSTPVGADPANPDGVIYGALLVDDTQDGESRYLLEKLVDGESFGPNPGMEPTVPKPAKDVKWKKEPMLIFVGDKIEVLKDFEKLAPGFTKMFGPVVTLPLEKTG